MWIKRIEKEADWGSEEEEEPTSNYKNLSHRLHLVA